MKIKITGDSMSIISDITKENFSKATKMNPECARLSDDKGNICFCVAFEPKPSVSTYGVAFNSVTTDGKMCLTVPSEVLTKEEVAEKYCSVFKYAKAVEKAISEYLPIAESELNNVMESIDIA